jgi:hypothetical protein
MERGTRGSAERFWGVGAGGAALTSCGGDASGSAESGGGAENGTYVAGILDAGKDDKERSTGAWRSSEELVELEFAWLDECGDALWMFGIGDAFKKAIGCAEDWEASVGAADERGETLPVAFTGLAEEDSFDAAGGAESLFDEARTFDTHAAVFRGKAAAQGHAELLEPSIVAAGEEVGGRAGFGRRGHWRKVSKFAGGKAIGRVPEAGHMRYTNSERSS